MAPPPFSRWHTVSVCVRVCRDASRFTQQFLPVHDEAGGLFEVVISTRVCSTWSSNHCFPSKRLVSSWVSRGSVSVVLMGVTWVFVSVLPMGAMGVRFCPSFLWCHGFGVLSFQWVSWGSWFCPSYSVIGFWICRSSRCHFFSFLFFFFCSSNGFHGVGQSFQRVSWVFVSVLPMGVMGVCFCPSNGCHGCFLSFQRVS